MKAMEPSTASQSMTYVLATAAYNEEKLIEKTLQSVVSQTVRPAKWVIVNDGSTDRTEQIVQEYARQYDFIRVSRITEEHPRNLTAQVHAINKGFTELKSTPSDLVGNLDSDISFEPTYFERLLEKFRQDPHLGLAGGLICEEQNGEFKSRKTNTLSSVAHAVQLFRRECLDALGGYKPFTWAGADWYAEVSLRMMGWYVQTFPDLKVFHHRPTGQGFGLLRYWYKQGTMDFYMGTHPLFEVFKLARRFQGKPYVIGSLVRSFAFMSAYCTGQKRQVSDEFMKFLRQEEMERIRAWFAGQKDPRSPRVNATFVA